MERGTAVTDETQDTGSIGLPVTRGTDGEILGALWTLAYAEPFAAYIDDVYAALLHILEGGREAEAAGERFVVVEPEWTVEQDVYGCEQGRACVNVLEEQRQRFEALIAARLARNGGAEKTAPTAEDDEQPLSAPEPEG
jgi:hypothetical protein